MEPCQIDLEKEKGNKTGFLRAKTNPRDGPMGAETLSKPPKETGTISTQYKRQKGKDRKTAKG